MTLYFDERWQGPHGIGRYAREVAARCGMEPAKLRGSPLGLLDPLQMALKLPRLKAEHFFIPGFNPPLGNPCSFSLTLHDLIHLTVQEERSPAKTLYYNHLVKPALHRADRVFTVSNYSRERIIEWSGVEPEKILLSGNGVSPVFSPEGACWPHKRPYLLYVGNQKPHKNIEGLIGAFAVSGLAKDFDLLLSGNLKSHIATMIETLGLNRTVQSTGLVSDADVPALYRSAYALIMPSRHEGFGLPVVEAMASGTPVLCSNRTSLPEVGGDAVLYFDPDDEESFVQGLQDLLDTDCMAGMRERGLVRARLFDWDGVAARIMSAIKTLGKRQ